MLVVLDSNILFSDFHLDRPRLRLIREQAEAGLFRLVLPEVVVRETVNLYRQELEKAGDRLEESIQAPVERLQQLKVKYASPSLDIDALVEDYEGFLREVAENTGGEIPGLPGISENEVVERALAKRKPFKKNSDAGYRDTLIWHNVLVLAAEDDVILISGNNGDFAEKDEPANLASDLRDDLAQGGLPRDRVQLLPNTALFIREHVPESAQVRQTVQTGVDDPQSEIYLSLQALAAEALEGYTPSTMIPGVLESGTDEVELPYNAEDEGATVEYADDLREVEILDARVDRGTAILELEALADLTFSFFVPKWELWQMEEAEEPKAYVMDANWSDHYAWLEGSFPTRLTAVAIYDVENGEFESVEVTHLATP